MNRKLLSCITTQVAVLSIIGGLSITASARPVPDGAEMPIKITGTITSDLMSVTIPTEVPFNINPNKSMNLNQGVTHVTNPSDAFVINHSGAPITITVDSLSPTKISSTADTVGQSFELVQRIAQIQPGTALLVLGTINETFNQRSFQSRALREGNDIDIPVATIGVNTKTALNVYGQMAVDENWQDFNITVTPTIKVEMVAQS